MQPHWTGFFSCLPFFSLAPFVILFTDFFSILDFLLSSSHGFLSNIYLDLFSPPNGFFLLYIICCFPNKNGHFYKPSYSCRNPQRCHCYCDLYNWTDKPINQVKDDLLSNLSVDMPQNISPLIPYNCTSKTFFHLLFNHSFPSIILQMLIIPSIQDLFQMEGKI